MKDRNSLSWRKKSFAWTLFIFYFLFFLPFLSSPPPFFLASNIETNVCTLELLSHEKKDLNETWTTKIVERRFFCVRSCKSTYVRMRTAFRHKRISRNFFSLYSKTFSYSCNGLLSKHVPGKSTFLKLRKCLYWDHCYESRFLIVKKFIIIVWYRNQFKMYCLIWV